MSFKIEPSSNPPQRPRGSRNKNTLVLLALLPDPLGENPSDAAIQRYAERIDRALARLGPKRNAARRGWPFAGEFMLGTAPPRVLQRSKNGGWACKQQAKYKRGRVAAQRGARLSTGRSCARAVPQ
jgi:hypothetical protein